METKRLLATFLVFFFAFSVFAVNKKKDSERVSEKNTVNSTEKKSKENAEKSEDAEITAEKKWQFLEWDEDAPEFVLCYEVVIEECNLKTNEWSEIRRNKTEDNTPRIQVNPLLPPGKYRYKIISYNMIEIAATESDWYDFMIYQAFQPKVNSLSANVNKSSTLYLEEFNDGIFKIEGENLFSPDKSPTSYTEYKLSNIKKKNSFVNVSEILESDNKKARSLSVKFDMNSLDTGKYYFVATDASGLKSEEDKKSLLTIKYKKAVDFDVSGGYSCPVILYDDTIKTYMGSSVWPLSMYAKASFIPFKHKYGYLGMGVSANYTRMSVEFDDYSVYGNMLNTHGLFIFQFPIRVKTNSGYKHIMTLEAHGGVGITAIYDLKFDFERGDVSDPLNSVNLSFIAGGAIQFYTVGRLFVELNVDYIQAFMSDMSLGMLVPSAGIGWQF